MRRIAVVVLVVLLAACTKKKEGEHNLNVENKFSARTVRLYYQGASMLLIPEQRSVQLPPSSAGALPIVVRELMKGAKNPGLMRSFPGDTVVRGAFLLPDGTAFVDLGGATLTAGWGTGSHEELMAVYSLVQTVVADFPEVKRVRILVNGTPAETLGGHVALDKPLLPNASLVDARMR